MTGRELNEVEAGYGGRSDERSRRRDGDEGLRDNELRSIVEQLAASSGGGRLATGREVGDLVEVATRFTGSWSRGFVVAAVEQHAYRVRRLSDGYVLPVTFSADELRAECRRGDVQRTGAA